MVCTRSKSSPGSTTRKSNRLVNQNDSYPPPPRMPLFENRTPHVERQVDLNSINVSGISNIFSSRQWQHICDIPEPKVPVQLVREFYASICYYSDTNLDHLSYIPLTFRGKTTTFSIKFIQDTLRLPQVAKPEFPFIPSKDGTIIVPPNHNRFADPNYIISELLGHDHAKWGTDQKTWNVGTFTLFYRILNIICCYNISPTSNTGIVHLDRARLLVAIGKGLSIDLPSYIFKIILRSAYAESSCAILPFASLITKWLFSLVPPLTINMSHPVVCPKKSISVATFKHGAGQMIRAAEKAANSQSTEMVDIDGEVYGEEVEKLELIDEDGVDTEERALTERIEIGEEVEGDEVENTREVIAGYRTGCDQGIPNSTSPPLPPPPTFEPFFARIEHMFAQHRAFLDSSCSALRLQVHAACEDFISEFRATASASAQNNFAQGVAAKSYHRRRRK